VALLVEDHHVSLDKLGEDAYNVILGTSGRILGSLTEGSGPEEQAKKYRTTETPRVTL
jgi:hypothetical protein